ARNSGVKVCFRSAIGTLLLQEKSSPLLRSKSRAVFDSIALADLAKAINGLTAAIVADTASEEAQHTSQMTAAIIRFTEVMDRWEDDHGRQPRRR
ncbi:hypothetical protein ABID82_005796, partial [Methylobacterium sp. PvP062]